MYLFKRADKRSPYWYVSCTDPKTRKRRRQSLKTANKDEAHERATDLLRNRRQGKQLVTIAEALDLYCRRLEKAGKSSAAGARSLAAKILGRRPGRFGLDPGMDLMVLDSALCARLVAARQDEGNSPQTIAHELKLLRAATRYAHKLGKVVPIDMIDGSKRDAWEMPALPTKTRYLTLEEFRAVYNWLDPCRLIEGVRGGQVLRFYYPPESSVARQRADAQDLLVALTLCGGRWSEVASLRWDRIDLDRKVIRLWGGKTSRERLVGLPDMVLAMLSRRWAERQSEQELVFPSLSGAQLAQPSRAIRRAMEACGLNTPEKVEEMGRATIHSLRHTFASLLLQNGASLADIQSALGHTTLAMTMRYAHLLQAESAAKLATILNGVIK